jgi:predicted lipoprotein with Yx(FWY)xxD motif
MASTRSLSPARAGGLAATLAALALAAGCGKVITIGDAGAPPAAPAPAASSTPSTPSASSAGAPAGGNDALQVVDQTAAQDGKTGNGGTVIGVQVQEKPPKWVQLSAVRSPSLDGSHLININQAALYRFDKDTAKPSTSACDGDCAVTWPPVTIEETGKVYLAGIDPKKVGAIRRDDGQVQLTVGGWPIYRFSGDTEPGDLKGQGVGGTWFAVGPKGEKVKGRTGQA